MPRADRVDAEPSDVGRRQSARRRLFDPLAPIRRLRLRRTCYAAARAGDESARAATIAAARAVGQGLASVVNVLNPDTVVLAGHLSGLFEDYQHTFLEELRFTLSRESLEVQVVPPAFGTDSIVIGAAELALEPVLIRPQPANCRNWAVRSE